MVKDRLKSDLQTKYSIKNNEKEVLRWWRKRTGKPLFPLQINQKIILVLSNLHKTTSESWQRTPGTQTGNPFSLKGGRTRYKRKKERQKS